MSELDENRISKFLSNIDEIQVLITCTKKIDIKNSISYNVVNGIIEKK